MRFSLPLSLSLALLIPFALALPHPPDMGPAQKPLITEEIVSDQMLHNCMQNCANEAIAIEARLISRGTKVLDAMHAYSDAYVSCVETCRQEYSGSEDDRAEVYERKREGDPA